MGREREREKERERERERESERFFSNEGLLSSPNENNIFFFFLS